MWTQLLTSTVIAAAIGAASALAVMYFTPRLQHRFWRRQRQDELRLETANEFNRVITQYVVSHYLGPSGPQLGSEWFTAINLLVGRVHVLFSETAYQAVIELDRMIGPRAPRGNASANEVSDARDAALRLLYSEVLPLAE